MKINHNIFRAYDIRGVYPEEINETTAYLIGRSYVKFLKKKNPKIVVGRDARLSSPELFKGLIEGLIDEGTTVINIGFSTSPMLYFAVANFGFDGGIEISASHNPPQYNGFKLVREKSIPISEKTGLKEIQKIAQKNNAMILKSGKMIKKNILKNYINFNLKDFNQKDFKNLKIVVDTANSVSGILIPKIFKKMPFKIHHIFSKLDGNFPNHNPNPVIKNNLKWLQKEILKRKADLGIAFDGDGDRIIFVDEKAEVIPGDLISALLSKIILKDFPKEKILYDIRSSNIVPETIKKNKGIPIGFKVGHALIKEKISSQNILFAGELTGHYYLRNHYFCEAPFFILFKVLEEIFQSGKNISELIKPFKVYFHTGEINFTIRNKEKILKLIKRKFKNGTISYLDGLRVDFKDWWFLIRLSGTENFLRLIVEAKTKKIMEEKKKELSSLILKTNKQKP